MKSISYLFVLLSLYLASSVAAQTPQQSYFEWTTLPFTKEELAQRRSNLLKALRLEGKTSGIVLIPSKDGFTYGETFRQLNDFYYFTGLELPNSVLVIDVSSEAAVTYCPERDLRFERASRPNDFPGMPLLADASITAASGMPLKNMSRFSVFVDSIEDKGIPVFVNNGRTGAMQQASKAYVASITPIQSLLLALNEAHPELVIENLYGAIANVRMIKSPAEIEIMRKSIEITMKSIQLTAKEIKPGVDERYLEGVLEGSYKMNGSSRLAFGSIIKSGPNSLWPWRILATHYDRRNRIMQEGELVIMDVGCEYQYYVSDMGRTFPVSGKFSEKQKEILEMETSISDQIIAYLKPGITFSDVRALTDRIIPEEAKKYMQVGLYFGHHLGLSTGDPNLPDAALQPGMIFTVEPWYYNHDEQISVFTEDVVLITEEGNEVLTKALPRTPEGIENMMK